MWTKMYIFQSLCSAVSSKYIEDHTQEKNSYLLGSSYTNPIQIPTKSHFRLFYEADLERIWNGPITDLKRRRNGPMSMSV
jgi:hypothetical protein